MGEHGAYACVKDCRPAAAATPRRSRPVFCPIPRHTTFDQSSDKIGRDHAIALMLRASSKTFFVLSSAVVGLCFAGCAGSEMTPPEGSGGSHQSASGGAVGSGGAT